MPGPHSFGIGEGASVSTMATSGVSPRSGEVARDGSARCVASLVVPEGGTAAVDLR